MSAPAPTVSVVMAVRDGAPWLDEALGSIERQSWRDFEIVLVLDGPRDETPAIAEAWAGRERRLVVRRQAPAGLAAALNHGVSVARGRLIARMDGDDRMCPERLALQVAAFAADPSLAVCGGAFRTFGSGKGRVVRPPADDGAIRARLAFGSPFAHPTTMMRAECLRVLPGPYDGTFTPAEDYELWRALAPSVRWCNLSATIHEYRVHDGQMTQLREADRRAAVRRVQERYLAAHGVGMGEGEWRAHAAANLVPLDAYGVSLCEVEAWLRRLARCGALHRALGAAWRHELAEAWYRANRRLVRSCADVVRFWRSPLNRRNSRAAVRSIRLLALRQRETTLRR